MAKNSGPNPSPDTSDYERIEAEYKQLQIMELREKLEARQAERDRLAHLRKKQLEDFERNQNLLQLRQAQCKHRKGGKDNKFGRGDSNNFSIIRNTYPAGEMEIMCTRCFKTVRRPDPRTARSDPDYRAKLAEWKKWDDMPTDNSPSGGKIFEIIPAAAA